MNNIKYTGAIALILLLTINSYQLWAQENIADKIVMLDGEEKIGQVTEITDDQIKFMFQGEKLEYSIKKSEINKIQFSFSVIIGVLIASHICSIIFGFFWDHIC